MSGITTRSAYGKLQKPNSSDKDLRNESYITGQPIGSNRRSLDVFPMGVYEVSASDIVEAGSNDYLVKATAHGAKIGDVFRILTSANSINEFEVFIDKIVDANFFELSSVLSASLSAGDTFSILRPVSNKLSADGTTLATIANNPVQFNLNGVATNVAQDTVTPANNRPLPVKLIDFAGDISITASQLNVNLDDINDSVAIGNGSGTILGLPGSEFQVKDQASLTELIAVNAELDGIKTDTSNLSAIKAAVELVDDTIATNGGAALTKFQTVGGHTGSTSHAWHVDGSGVGRVDVRASVLPPGASTSSLQTTGNASLSSLDAKSPALVGGRVPVDGSSVTQPISVVSLPLPTGAATSAEQITTNSTLSNIDADLGSPADAAVSNPASSASVIAAIKGLLTLIGSTNTKLDSIELNTSPEFSNFSTQTVTDVSAATFTAPASAKRMVIQNSLAADGPIRFVPAANTPTASSGFYLGVGQSTSEIPAGSFKAIGVDSGVVGDVTVIWFV
jgi:hypothetical protein